MVRAGRRSWPQPGQASRRWSKAPASRASGGKATRSCLGCPGCPPILRLSWPTGGGGLGGLTMSEEGGLEEVEESLRAAASCACSWSKAPWRALNSTCRSSSRACNRWQFGQEGVDSALMAANSTSHRISYNPPVNRHVFRPDPRGTEGGAAGDGGAGAGRPEAGEVERRGDAAE